MGSELILPTAYFVTSKGKQLSKSNPNGLVVNTIDNEYQKVTISVGAISSQSLFWASNSGGYNYKKWGANSSSLWFSPYAWTTSTWDGLGSSTNGMSNGFGAITGANVNINGYSTTINVLCWSTSKTSDMGSLLPGMHMAILGLNKFVGDVVYCLYNGVVMPFTIYYGLINSSNGNDRLFIYTCDYIACGGQMREAGFDLPTGNVDFYISKNSFYNKRNAILPTALGGNGSYMYVG